MSLSTRTLNSTALYPTPHGPNGLSGARDWPRALQNDADTAMAAGFDGGGDRGGDRIGDRGDDHIGESGGIVSNDGGGDGPAKRRLLTASASGDEASTTGRCVDGVINAMELSISPPK